MAARGNVEIAALGHDRERLVEQRLEREPQLSCVGDRGRPAGIELLEHEVVPLAERFAALLEQIADHLGDVHFVAPRRIERRDLLESREQPVNPPDVLSHHLREARTEVRVVEALGQDVVERSIRVIAAAHGIDRIARTPREIAVQRVGRRRRRS